jgi:uncharacterized membrane protein
MLRHKSSDLLIIIAVAGIATIFLYYEYGNSAFRAILALPFALFLPGYAALMAINPHVTIRRPEFILLSVGLSLAVTALCGLLLNWTPGGMQSQSWSIALGVFIIVASLIGLSRRREISLTPSASFSIGLDCTQQIMLGLAVVIVVAAFTIARQGALQQPTTPFTQLWLLPPEETESSIVQIGILNQENKTLTYRLQLISEPFLLMQWTSIELESGKTWETTFDLPADLDRSEPVKARLYRQDSPGVIYRETLIWVDQTS